MHVGENGGDLSSGHHDEAFDDLVSIETIADPPVALVNPSGIVMVMDAFCEGWTRGRHAKNIHFTKWEEQLDRSLVDIRNEYDVIVTD